MNCAPLGDPDCNVPPKTVEHFDTFESKQAALEFVNSGFKDRDGWKHPDVSGTLFAVTPPVPNPKPAKFLGLYELRLIPTNQWTWIEKTPQPDKVEEKVTVTVK